jgi:hypothetical protein
MKPFFRETVGVEDWKGLLAAPEKHWRPGYSAHSLAHAWEKAGGLPARVRSLLQSSRQFRDFELLLAIPELQVDLPGGTRPSQTDLWLLGRVPDGLASVAVEGKVAEPFGPTVAEWLEGASSGKHRRLDFLAQTLHVHTPVPAAIRYQLLHRTASAIIMADRFHAKHALMLVHSFSPTKEWKSDYDSFASALGVGGPLDGVVEVPGHGAPTLSLAWVSDEMP